MIRQLYPKHFKCSMNDLPETPRTSDQYLVRWHSLTDEFTVLSHIEIWTHFDRSAIFAYLGSGDASDGGTWLCKL